MVDINNVAVDKKLTIGLLFGGRSGEHEVSISSATAIASVLNQNPRYLIQLFYIQKDGLWRCPASFLDLGTDLKGIFQLPSEVNNVDLWFPVLHGPNGEDGTLQGLLQLIQKPFVGNGVLASAAGMDKIVMKSLFAQAGLAQVKYLSLTHRQQESETEYEQIEAELGYPCFVKPSNLGSSVGISKVRNRQELAQAIALATTYDPRIIIEQGVNAREIECAVLGNGQPQASIVGEITFNSDFYDYETKYTPGRAELIIPAQIPAEVTKIVQSMAVKAFQAIAGSGLARVDFFYLEASGTVLINEINTMPGFTATSMYPKLWQASGIEFNQLCDRLIELALE